MANNISLGIVIGAATSSSVGRAFSGLDAQASRLGRSLQQVRLGRAAGEDVARYRASLVNLEAVQTQLGGGNAHLARMIDQTRRSLLTATAAARRYGVDVGDITRQNRQLLQSEERLAGQLQRANVLRANRDHRNQLGGQAMGAAGMAIGAAYSISAPVRTAIEFESKMADIRKVSDMTTAELEALKKEIIKTSTIMPVSATGIGSIVELGLQSNISKTEILGFKDAAVKMSIAFNMSGEEAGQTMAGWRAGMAISQKETEDLADAINYLDSKMNSTAKSISAVISRQGAVAKAAGLTTIETAALSSALLNSNVSEEIAATALKNLTNALTQGGSATKAQNKVFEQLGMTSTAVTAGMQKDAEGTIKSVFAALSKMPAEMHGAMVGDLFGEEAKGAIMPLLVNLKALYEAFGHVAKSTQYADSMLAEYEIRSKTTANNAQLLSNKFDALQETVGSALLPTMNTLFDVIGNITLKFSEWADKHQPLIANVIGVSMGLIGLKVATLAVGYVFSWLSTTWTMATGAMAFFSSGLIGTRIGLAALSVQAFAVGAAQKAMAAWTGIVTAAQWLWNASLFGCPIVWIIGVLTAFGALAFTVYKNWEPITAWFKQAWADLGLGVQAVGAIINGAFSTMAANVKAIWESLINWLTEKFAQIGAMANKLVTTAQTIGNTVSSIGKFMTTPIIGAGKGAAVGAAMAATAAMPAHATPLPAMTGGKQPQSVMYNTNATIHVTQKAGENSNDFADRVIKKLKTQEAADKRGRLHD